MLTAHLSQKPKASLAGCQKRYAKRSTPKEISGSLPKESIGVPAPLPKESAPKADGVPAPLPKASAPKESTGVPAPLPKESAPKAKANLCCQVAKRDTPKAKSQSLSTGCQERYWQVARSISQKHLKNSNVCNGTARSGMNSINIRSDSMNGRKRACIH